MTGGVSWTERQFDGSFAAEVTPDVETLATCIGCGSCTACCPTGPQAFGRTLAHAGLSFTTLAGEEWCCGYAWKVLYPRYVRLPSNLTILH